MELRCGSDGSLLGYVRREHGVPVLTIRQRNLDDDGPFLIDKLIPVPTVDENASDWDPDGPDAHRFWGAAPYCPDCHTLLPITIEDATPGHSYKRVML